MTATPAVKPPRNGQLPFWVSPWRWSNRSIATTEGQTFSLPHFVCTVAKSRSDRHRGVEIAIPSVVLNSLKSKERQQLFSDRIVDALKQLGMVANGEDQRRFKGSDTEAVPQ